MISRMVDTFSLVFSLYKYKSAQAGAFIYSVLLPFQNPCYGNAYENGDQKGNPLEKRYPCRRAMQMATVLQIRIVMSHDRAHHVGKQYGKDTEYERKLFHGIPPTIFCFSGATMRRRRSPKRKESEKCRFRQFVSSKLLRSARMMRG